MSEEPNPNQNPEPDKLEAAGVTMLWLMLGFVPSLVGILTINQLPTIPRSGLLAILVVCCLASAFGILRRTKDVIVRIFTSMFLAAALAVLNIIIVVFVGCSQMGHI